MILSNSNLDYETIRKLVFEVIKEDDFSQYAGIKNGVANRLIKYGYSSETNSFALSSYSSKELNKEDAMKVSEIIWDLIIERVLTIGLNESNDQWPFLRLTEYGKKL